MSLSWRKQTPFFSFHLFRCTANRKASAIESSEGKKMIFMLRSIGLIEDGFAMGKTVNFSYYLSYESRLFGSKLMLHSSRFTRVFLTYFSFSVSLKWAFVFLPAGNLILFFFFSWSENAPGWSWTILTIAVAWMWRNTKHISKWIECGQLHASPQGAKSFTSGHNTEA